MGLRAQGSSRLWDLHSTTVLAALEEPTTSPGDLFFFFLSFFGPHPQQMEVPRLGVKSDL